MDGYFTVTNGIDWYEAASIRKRELKIKYFLD